MWPAIEGRRFIDEADAARGGFTLIELLVVLIVISLLASLVAPAVFRHVGDASRDTARAQIELLGLALDAYRLDNGAYPTSDQGLDALWERPRAAPEPPRWRGPYTRRPVPLDPWGRAYVYRSPGSSRPDAYDLTSLGRDGVEGGEGEDADLTSWESAR